MKKLINKIYRRLLRNVPFDWIRKLLATWISSNKHSDPKTLLIHLFLLDDDTNRAIDKATFSYEKDHIHSKHRLTRYHDFFVDKLSPGERVLDIGCGYGAVAHSMASRAQAVVTGIDISKANITKAKKTYRHPNLEFILGDALVYLPEKAIDTIVISNVLEHIEKRVEFIQSVENKLSPKRWLVRVPMFSRNWTVPLRKELGIPYYSDPTHFTEYSPESFIEEMKQAKMKIIDIQINWGEIWAEISHE